MIRRNAEDETVQYSCESNKNMVFLFLPYQTLTIVSGTAFRNQPVTVYKRLQHY